MPNTRIRIPATAATGDLIEIRAMIMHPMENGFRVDTQGTPIPVDIVTDFTCRFEGEDVFSVKLEPGLSANPYFSFFFKAAKSGRFDFEWIDQHGTTTTNSASITVT